LVRLPLLRPAISTAAAFSAALSLGEFGATAFLARTDSRTLPVLVDLLVGRSGERPFAAAMAASTLLFVITFALVLGVDRRRST
jgi:thiamine transport system permease protein